MFIYNTSFHVADGARQVFITWLKAVFIPSALSDGFFRHPVLTRILMEVEPGSTSYALQLYAPELEQAREWESTTGAQLRLSLHKQLGEQVLSFVTFMEILSDEQPA